MEATEYQYAIDYTASDGTRVGLQPVQPDWQPAREWSWFDGMRRGLLPASTLHPPGEIEPIWHAEHGAPICSGVRVVVPREAGDPLRTEIPRAYFHDLAQQRAAQLVERGELRAGERFRYQVVAYPVARPRELTSGADGSALAVEPVGEALPLEEAPLEEFLGRARACGEAGDDDAPVFVQAEVLEDARRLSAASGELEVGGLLVGKLHRPPGGGEIFVEVSAQIFAQHAESKQTRFVFTPDTWAAAEAALRLRRRGERFVGWWHHHPNLCRSCPVERSRECRLARPFFSADDVRLHRTCFPQAWQVALLTSDLPELGLHTNLFGWRRGLVQARGFHRLD